MMQISKNIQIQDVSNNTRFGIKGSQAEHWLNQQAISPPELANHWLESSQGLLVLRLGQSEFLIESISEQQSFSQLQNASNAKLTGMYAVPRSDAAFKLHGENINELIAQICMLDAAIELRDNALLMTQVAGVSAILLKEATQQNDYRLWCDVSYRDYMINTLCKLATQMNIITSLKY
jgi:sarcosine oxidase subunit gamma